MVCDRCIMAVNDIFSRHNISICCTGLGYVETKEDVTEEQILELERSLNKIGFEIIRERKEQTINEVKMIIVELLNSEAELQNIQLSKNVSNKIQHDYKSISTLFSQSEGITIEKYFIRQRVERVKELITYDLLSLSEIAFKLRFSRVAHLSNQFKQVTGLTPTKYKSTIATEQYKHLAKQLEMRGMRFCSLET